MPDTSLSAEGLPIVEAEPVPSEPFRQVRAIVLSGEFTIQRRGQFAVLTTPAGNAVFLDAHAVKCAAIALGVTLAR